MRVSGETQSNWSTNKTPSFVQESVTYVSSNVVAEISLLQKRPKFSLQWQQESVHVTLTIYFSGHVGTFPWACMHYPKSKSLAILELLAFTAPKFYGNMTLATCNFPKFISGLMWGLFLGARTPNLMFVSFAVMKLLAFKLQFFIGSRDPDHAPFTLF